MREDHPSAGFWILLFARTIDLILILAAFNLFSLGDRMGADAGLPGPERIRRGVSGSRDLRKIPFPGRPISYPSIPENCDETDHMTDRSRML